VGSRRSFGGGGSGSTVTDYHEVPDKWAHAGINRALPVTTRTAFAREPAGGPPEGIFGCLSDASSGFMSMRGFEFSNLLLLFVVNVIFPLLFSPLFRIL
jgi:hypothetical protein